MSKPAKRILDLNEEYDYSTEEEENVKKPKLEVNTESNTTPLPLNTSTTPVFWKEEETELSFLPFDFGDEEIYGFYREDGDNLNYQEIKLCGLILPK